MSFCQLAPPQYLRSLRMAGLTGRSAAMELHHERRLWAERDELRGSDLVVAATHPRSAWSPY